MAEKQEENIGLESVSPAIKRSETSAVNDRKTGKTSEKQTIEIRMGDKRGIDIVVNQFRFNGRVEEVLISLSDCAKLDNDYGQFEFVIKVRRNDTYGAVCQLVSETSDNCRVKKGSFWLPGSEAEVYDYFCYNKTAKGFLALQKETRNMTSFVDTIVATDYVGVDNVTTFVVTVKVKTNSGAGLSVEVEDPVRQSCDFAKEKILCFIDKNTAAMKSGGALISQDLNSESKSLLPNGTASSRYSNSGKHISNSGRVNGNYNGSVISKYSFKLFSL